MKGQATPELMALLNKRMSVYSEGESNFSPLWVKNIRNFYLLYFISELKFFILF